MRKPEKQKKQRERIYAALFCICTMLSLVSVPVLAAEMRKGVGSHKHTPECYTWMEKCVHEHTLECYPQKEITESAATSSDAVEATECCHVCSEESGCITKELNCQYDSESTPITAKALMKNKAIATRSNARKVSSIDRAQEMIDALPDVTDINNNNIEEVRLQFKAVEDAMIQLSVEDSVVLDIARYLKVAAVLYGPFPDIQNPILGTDIKWTISRDNKTITISGKGEMPDFDNSSSGKRCPWEDKKSKIDKVIIEEGVTTIGKDAFSKCIRLSEVQIPKTVKTIGTGAFYDCNTLRQIDIPNSVKNVMPFAFHKCPQLGKVHTHWKDPDEAELSLAFYLPGESWPENLKIYVPDAYKEIFAAAWTNWKVMGETYTVSFDGDGAPGYMESVEGISGNYVLPESGFTYQSAILDYWALDNPDGEKAGCPGDIFPVTENVVFYASWRLVIVIPEPENPVVCIHAWGEWQSDADKHWRKCSKCDASDIREDHSGGMATCKDQAVCSVCGAAYGELNPDHHTGGTEVRGRVEATASADGYTGDTYCKGCGIRIAAGQAVPKDPAIPTTPTTPTTPTIPTTPTVPTTPTIPTTPTVPTAPTTPKKDSSSSGSSDDTTSYTLNFHANGGGGISAIGGTYGKTVSLSDYIPTREGYDFTGWYSDQALTQRITELRMIGNRTVYAGWIKSNSDTWANPFTDVYGNDRFYKDVMFVYEKGLMSGISATTFAPNTNITRAQIAVIFYRMSGSPAVEGKNHFTDVEYGPGTVGLYDAVTWAQQNGIMGDSDGKKFGPDDPVTREQLASIFYRYAQVRGHDITQVGMAAGSDLLDLKGTVTRAETAEMLHQFVEKQGLKPVAASTGATEWVKPTS